MSNDDRDMTKGCPRHVGTGLPKPPVPTARCAPEVTVNGLQRNVADRITADHLRGWREELGAGSSELRIVGHDHPQQLRVTVQRDAGGFTGSLELGRPKDTGGTTTAWPDLETAAYGLLGQLQGWHNAIEEAEGEPAPSEEETK